MVASRMQKQLFLPFCWLDRPITALLPGVPLSCPLAVRRRDLKEPLNCFVRVFGRASCVPVQTAQLNAPTPKGASLCESLISRLLRAQMGDL